MKENIFLILLLSLLISSMVISLVYVYDFRKNVSIFLAKVDPIYTTLAMNHIIN